MFSIIEHLEKLTPDTGSQTNGNPSFICPVCEAPNFKVDLKTGKYNSFSCDCTSTPEGKRTIINTLSPKWEKPVRPKDRKTWKYYDLEGNAVIEVIRTDDGEGRRKFLQVSLIKGKDPREISDRCTLYRWAEVKKAIEENRQILWVEGEGVADSLWDIGIPATTTIGGCKGAQGPEKYIEWIPSDLLVICPDRDQVGMDYSLRIEKHHPTAKWCYAFPDSWMWDRLPPNSGADLKDWIENGATAGEILGAIEPKRVPKPQEPKEDEEETDAEVEQTFQEQALQDIFNHGSHWIAIESDLYKFTGTHYERQHPGEVRKLIRKWASQQKVFNLRKGKFTYAYMTPRSINQIFEWAILSFAVSPDEINPPGINLANGVLRITWNGRIPSWKLDKHSPDDYYLGCSDVVYDPNADPHYSNKMLDCLEPLPRAALMRTIAAGFDLPAVRKLRSRGVRALIARGSGSNGKDSIRLACELLFKGALVSVDLSDFRSYDSGEKKWYLVPLEGAALNWSSENNKGTALDCLDSLNLAITGEPLKKETKGGSQPTYFNPRCTHIFNVNRLPSISSGLDSIMSRFAIIDFTKSYKDNPDPTKGEIKADPRFKEDREFMIKEVCPAFLNELLEELKNLAQYGIDYKAIQESLNEIQDRTTHLWQFVRDAGIVTSSEGRIYIKDLWERLQEWYIDNGTLELNIRDNGKTDKIWNDQPNKYDRNVRAANQVTTRFLELFPKAKQGTETADKDRKGQTFLDGIAFSGSLPHHPDSERDTASLTASLCLTTASPEDQAKGNGEAMVRQWVTQSVTQKPALGADCEAVRQSSVPITSPEIVQSSTEIDWDDPDAVNKTLTAWDYPIGSKVVPTADAWLYPKFSSVKLPKFLTQKAKANNGAIKFTDLPDALYLALTEPATVMAISKDGDRLMVRGKSGDLVLSANQGLLKWEEKQ